MEWLRIVTSSRLHLHLYGSPSLTLALLPASSSRPYRRGVCVGSHLCGEGCGRVGVVHMHACMVCRRMWTGGCSAHGVVHVYMEKHVDVCVCVGPLAPTGTTSTSSVHAISTLMGDFCRFHTLNVGRLHKKGKTPPTSIAWCVPYSHALLPYS